MALTLADIQELEEDIDIHDSLSGISITSLLYDKVDRSVTNEKLYDTSEIAAKQVDVLPEEATKNGIKFKDQQLSDIFTEFDLIEKCKHSWQRARRCGGCLLMPITNHERTSKFNFNSEYKIDGFTIIPKIYVEDIKKEQIDLSVLSGNFLKPKFYNLKSKPAIKHLHHSHVIRFDGIQASDERYVSNQYWHNSALERCRSAILDYQEGVTFVRGVLRKLVILVFKFHKAETLSRSDDGKKVLRKRGNAISRSIRNHNTASVGASEEVSSVAIPMTGIKDAIKVIKEFLQACVDLPHYLAFNENSGSVFSDSSSSVQEAFYSMIARQQQVYLKPKIDWLVKVIVNANNMPNIEDVGYEFAPLYQMSELEKQEARASVAETQKKIVEILKIARELDESSEFKPVLGSILSILGGQTA